MSDQCTSAGFAVPRTPEKAYLAMSQAKHSAIGGSGGGPGGGGGGGGVGAGGATAMDISNLMSPPDLPPIESFVGAGQSSPVVPVRVGMAMMPPNPPIMGPNEPLSPPISPLSSGLDVVVATPSSTPSAIADGKRPASPAQSTSSMQQQHPQPDPILYPSSQEMDRAAGASTSSTQSSGSATFSQASDPQRSSSRKAATTPLFNPEAERVIAAGAEVVDRHVAMRRAGLGGVLFRNVDPPRTEEYAMALQFRTEMMDSYVRDPRGWLERERAQLDRDRELRREMLLPRPPVVHQPQQQQHHAGVQRPLMPAATSTAAPVPSTTHRLDHHVGDHRHQYAAPASHSRFAGYQQQAPPPPPPPPAQAFGGAPATTAPRRVSGSGVNVPKGQAGQERPAVAAGRVVKPRTVAPGGEPRAIRASGGTAGPHQRHRTTSGASTATATGARRVSNGSTTPEPRRQSAPSREDKNFSEIEDYCPPLSTLDEPRNRGRLTAEWKPPALDLSRDPHRHLLHPDELKVAAQLRLDCATYLTSKRRIFRRLRECFIEGKEFRKTDAQQACKIDVNKASRLWMAYDAVGWLKLVHMRPHLPADYVVPNKWLGKDPM